MSIGTGIVLFVIGAILAFAVNVEVEWINLDIGVLVFLFGIILLARRRQTETVTRSSVDPATQERVDRRSTSTTDDGAGL